MSVRHAESASHLDDILAAKANSLVVIDFHAIWCAPCLAINPVIDAYSKSYPHVTFVKVDTDKLQDVAKKYNVTAMPTFVFVKNRQVVDTVKVPSPDVIRAAIAQHAGPSASTSGTSESTDQISLLEFVDRSQLNCLNEASDHNIKSIITGPAKNTGPAFLLSDTDEQLLLNIPFNQTVRVRGLSITSSAVAQAPKFIKIVINNPSIGFEDVENTAAQVTQAFELDEEMVTSGKPIQLRFVKFQSVQSIHIFVASNQGGEDETRIDSIDIYGLPGQTSRVSELRARDDH